MAKKTSSRTRAARQRRQRQRRQSRSALLIAAIIIVAVVAFAVFVVANQPVDAHIPDDLSAAYDGIPRSYSRDGYPQLGDTEAPVTVEEYASFACPGCQQFHEDSLESLLERVRAGQALFTYVPMQTGNVPNAQGAARAALCAGQQGMFWEMHDLLFDWQTRYGNTAFSQSRLLAGVEGLGMRESLFTGCFNSSAITATLNAALNEDVSTTPTLRVNGVTLEAEQGLPPTATILQAIDDATPDDWGLPSAPPAIEPAEAPTTIPTEAPAEPTAAEAEQADEASSEPPAAETGVAEEATPAPEG
ncbi:MAG: thioredoxin domain-containing protein [Chloroflexi bacterium]|nr:thioredoxin domain-containing protein [Chloroflexota bacterium]MCY3582013.1 thioredoxin domain-containing protein [Chloroflexota bacterium]MCY3716528.1 thioredoxin domain-containing protein [Chloroflexota bacterium]MDE2651637.1 thioredoxin domain-containing protein [Chloroflexota bacterium]MXX50626.1 thioredoxin domain-containing protein [Chloroflexota bacterium]